MDITWYGHSCFRMKAKGVAVVTDPCGKDVGYPVPRLRADIVTISCDHPDYCNTGLVQGGAKVIRSPGEYEIKGTFVTGVRIAQAKTKGQQVSNNTAYLFDFDGLMVCHLGTLDHVPSEVQLQTLISVDVLLVPVGGVTTINANQAAEVIGLLEPRLVVPMHYRTKVTRAKLEPVTQFLKEMGLPEPASARDILSVDKGDLPEHTQVVLLNYKE